MPPDISDNPDSETGPKHRLLDRLKRRQAAYRHIWTGRITFWGGAVLIGLIAVAFANMVEYITHLIRQIASDFPAWPFIAAPLGGAAIVYLTRRFFPGAEGSGIPQVMAEMARHGESHKPVQPLLSIRIILGKISLGAAAILSGFSMGREGPMVQVGAAVMHSIGARLPQRLQVDRRHLLAAGGAAGIAAAFNTPLAGILFAIEELSRGLGDRMSGLIITAIVIAGIVTQSFFGNYTYFGWLDITAIKSPHQPTMLLAAAVLCGLAGGTFARLLLITTDNTTRWMGSFRGRQPILFAAVCGLLVATVTYISQGTTYGTGYDEAKHLLSHSANLPWHYGLDKFVATVASFASGVPGGIFAPSLAIGAGLGQNLHNLMGGAYHPGMINLLCMVGFLAAVTQTPITAFVIVMEMISGYGMVIDLMIVSLMSSGISRAICPPLYRTLAARYLKQVGTPQVENPASKASS